MGLGLGSPLLVEPARLLHDGRSLPEQDGIARQAEDKIDPASMAQHLEHLGLETATHGRGDGFGASAAAERTGAEPRSWRFLAPGDVCQGEGRQSPTPGRCLRK